MNWMEYPVTDKKLGCLVNEDRVILRVWAPGCSRVDLALYDHPHQVRRSLHAMTPQEDGVFEWQGDRSFLGKCYTYLLEEREEITDPYSLGVTLNSTKSIILDPDKMDPSGWKEHVASHRSTCTNCLDAVVYEVHVMDFTIDPRSGVQHRGKYLGMVEPGTHCKGFATGLDHLKELGVTHIHLMPVFDFLTVDEEPTRFYEEDNYNWGYDPEHYNVPEGSYATDPHSYYARIHELKILVMELQKSGFSVVMDVVYNHTYRGKNSHLNRLAPDYYYRTWEDGTWSDGSGCGNELATERPMVRRFIMSSLEYWLLDFNLDGFRFDLMALIDVDTVYYMVDHLRKLREDVFLYGEPWTGGETVLPDSLRTTKGKQIHREFSFLNDNFRDAVKGDGNGEGGGFVHGNCDGLSGVETGMAGSIYYDDGHIGFAANPRETINYINSHDNLILQDKMKKMYPMAPEAYWDRLNRLSFAMLLLSQGVPLIHAGNEFLREKYRNNNSYNAPISVNAIDWTLKEKNFSFFQFMKDLIAFRRRRLEFRMRTTEDIKKYLKFFHSHGENCHTLGYTIQNPKNPQKFLFVAFHAGEGKRLITHRYLLEHLNRAYHFSYGEIKLTQIMDMDGLITPENRENNMDLHGILMGSHDFGVFDAVLS